MRDKLTDEIMMLLLSYGIKDQEAKNSLYLILSNYEISERNTGIVVRNEDINRTYLRRFIIAKTVKGCSERTLQEYRYVLWKILESINKTADEITTDDIRLYLSLRQKRDGISKSYANTELRYMKSFFSFLTSEGMIRISPVVRIENIKCEKKDKKAFEEMEVEKIRDICRTKKDKCIIEMLLSTGCRVSELAGIKISDIDGEKIVVHGKGGKDRTVFLNAKAVIALENYLDERKDRNPFLYPARTRRPPKGVQALWYTDPEFVMPDGHVDIGSIESMIRNLGKRSGVKNCHPHRFRRTCATMALRHGMPLMTVSKMLGHESVATTQIYLDLDEREVEQAHRKYVI